MSPAAYAEESEVEGERKWRLPNIRCESCPLTTGPMRSYPCVDLSHMQGARNFVDPRPVSPKRFTELAQMVRRYVPEHLPLERTAGLGPFYGRTARILYDYAVAFLWGSPLLRAQAFTRICRQASLRLQGIPARIRSTKEPALEMVEVQIDGFVSLAAEALPQDGLRVCPLCGRNNIKELRPESVVVKRSSIPAAGNIFDLIEFGTTPLVTERLRRAVGSAGLTNVRFDEVRIAEE